MGFTFPISFIVMSVAMRFGIGASSTISRAIGEGHPEKVRRLTTDAIGLAIIIVTCFAMIGLTNLQRIFSLMGADEEILNLISDYMILWFLGVGLLGIPIVSNGAIRATGDTKSPALIMIIAGLLNIVWDPFLIFGIGSFPRLELRGAAFATVISWSVTFAATLWILGKREKIICLPIFDLKQSLQSWKQILYISAPAAGTNALEPLYNGNHHKSGRRILGRVRWCLRGRGSDRIAVAYWRRCIVNSNLPIYRSKLWRGEL